jgi:hypothetical protein
VGEKVACTSNCPNSTGVHPRAYPGLAKVLFVRDWVSRNLCNVTCSGNGAPRRINSYSHTAVCRSCGQYTSAPPEILGSGCSGGHSVSDNRCVVSCSVSLALIAMKTRQVAHTTRLFVVWVGGIVSAELFDCFGRNNPGTSRLSPGFPGFQVSTVIYPQVSLQYPRRHRRPRLCGRAKPGLRRAALARTAEGGCPHTGI